MPRPTVRQTLILAICVAVAALFLFLWGCPYLLMHRQEKLCIALYAVLLLIYVFGRGILGRFRPRGASRPPS